MQDPMNRYRKMKKSDILLEIEDILQGASKDVRERHAAEARLKELQQKLRLAEIQIHEMSLQIAKSNDRAICAESVAEAFRKLLENTLALPRSLVDPAPSFPVDPHVGAGYR